MIMIKLISSLIIMIGIFGIASAQNAVKVACVGNSITQGPGRDHPESYPLQLQYILGKEFLVKNYGVSGRTLLKKGDFPYWDEPQFEEVLEFSPQILIIKLGTNDSKPQNWIHKNEFKKDYLDMIATFKSSMEKDAKIFICIPVPVTEDNYGITESVLVNEMRPLLYEVAEETGASIIDLYTPFQGKNELLPDGVHPNIEGLGIMAQEIAKAIK